MGCFVENSYLNALKVGQINTKKMSLYQKTLIWNAIVVAIESKENWGFGVGIIFSSINYLISY